MGNYNGVAAQTTTGSMVYIIATPSIITSQTGSTGSGFDITTDLANKLLMNGQTNSGGIAFTGAVVYSGVSLPSTFGEQEVFARSIASVYSGTSLVTNSQIEPFITAVQSNDTTKLMSLG